MSTTAALVGPRVKPREQVKPVHAAAVPAVLHVETGRDWGGGQNQVRLLMHELKELGLGQLCLCPEDSPLHRRLLKECLPVRGMKQRSALNPAALFSMARLMRTFHVVHTHDPHALQAALLPAKVLGLPIVAARRTGSGTRALGWSRADRVIAVSQCVKDMLVAGGVDASLIRLVYSGIDSREIRALPHARPRLRERTRIPEDAFLAGGIGALVPGHHQHLFVGAAALAGAVQWVLIGDGPMRPEIVTLIAHHGISDRVLLAGHVDDARQMLREIDVFVSAAVDEAIGTSILEAMAAGIPVIAADGGGSAEILAPVHAAAGASLFPPGSAPALAALVLRVREDTDLRARMISAQNVRLDDFRSDATALNTLSVYREVLR